MILRGPGAKDDRYDASDIAVYELIGKHGEEMLPGYKLMNVAVDLYEVYGGSIDWLHMMQGTFTFTNEMFTPFNFFRKPSPEGFFGRQEDQRAFEKYLLFGDGMVPWHEVNHPQYGKIEVGGPKKNWVRQPPSFLLEEECHRNMAFTLYHADQMPQVKVQSIDAKELASGLFEVTAVVVNQRVTPTHSSADLKKQDHAARHGLHPNKSRAADKSYRRHAIRRAVFPSSGCAETRSSQNQSRQHRRHEAGLCAMDRRGRRSVYSEREECQRRHR